MGCSPTRPYRTDLPDQPLNCPQTGEEVPESCRTSMWEHTDGYDLSFVEFDDQGLLYPKGKEGGGDAWQQLDRLMVRREGLIESWCWPVVRVDREVGPPRRILRVDPELLIVDPRVVGCLVDDFGVVDAPAAADGLASTGRHGSTPCR